MPQDISVEASRWRDPRGLSWGRRVLANNTARIPVRAGPGRSRAEREGTDRWTDQGGTGRLPNPCVRAEPSAAGRRQVIIKMSTREHHCADNGRPPTLGARRAASINNNTLKLCGARGSGRRKAAEGGERRREARRLSRVRQNGRTAPQTSIFCTVGLLASRKIPGQIQMLAYLSLFLFFRSSEV